MKKKRNPFNVIIGVAVVISILIFLLESAQVVRGCQWFYLTPILIAAVIIGVILLTAAAIAVLLKS